MLRARSEGDISFRFLLWLGFKSCRFAIAIAIAIAVVFAFDEHEI